MSEKIKNLFRKVKKGKFSGLGQGHKLNEEKPTGNAAASSSSRSKDKYVPPKRKELTSESRQAAAAALARFEKKDPKELNVSLAAIKAQARKELEAEKLRDQTASSDSENSQPPQEHKLFAVEGVYFRCPLISEEVLSKKEWQSRIKEFLYEQLEFEEKGLTSCLIIVNCNTKDRANNCKEIIGKYLDNIVNNPTEEKYRKIRMGNRVFCEKVKDVEGALDFLKAAGFVEQKIDDDDFLVWLGDEEDSLEKLKELMEAMATAEIIALEVDRNLQVLLPSQTRKSELPPDFFRLTPEEIKREQKLRNEVMEQTQILKTKAMREREEARAWNIYRYALIRIRFPDGIYIQGTFSVHEKLGAVFEFAQSCMKHEEIDFHLIGPTGHKMMEDDMEKSLYELRLIPNSVFSFQYDDTAAGPPPGNYVKEELMMLIK